MIKRIRRSPQSKIDLLKIWLHVAEHNPAAADKLVFAIEDKIQLLARWPGVGYAREDLALDLFGLPFGSYIIFYRKYKNTIELVRVLHGARDLPSIFSPTR